ncbi:hypothetical protein M422DRAFT_203211 [Sphaerobolus stellatus SS14]|nr:hypothetical protein M422DRAFT_203211 [Sphaerobolus stellatus SS14]
MSFIGKLAQFVEKAPSRLQDGIDHAKLTVEGLVNRDRRHDDPAEKRNDEIRAEINASHRFDSFASERSANFVKWHVDGNDYFWAVSELLDSAKECIMILDWWLTPELYLRRPPAYHPEWRLDRLLKKKAEQGVKIYIVVYKEVTQTMSMSSHHTKSALEALHENIAVMRHPDHIGSRDDVEFWSHHEKVVLVDNHRAAIGGLDLCFGRWDTHNHPLADVHPTDFSKTLFPGQDYNNARLLDFQQVDHFASNQVSILEAPRMPWHDVHMTFVGPVVLDVVQHFVERWNEIRSRKYSKDPRFEILALPHNVRYAPNEAVARHPHREQWAEMGRHFRQRFHMEPGRYHHEDEDESVYPRPPHGTMKVQVCRSVSDWSHGVLTEHSIQNAYIELITNANHFIYIENQFFISATNDKDVVKNQIARALLERILRAAQEQAKFHVVVVIPEVPGFSGNIADESAIKTIMAAQWRTINRGGNSIYEKIKEFGFDPMQYIRFYHLRAYDRINAPYPSFISKMEKNSDVSFFKAQVALARVWLGRDFGEHDTQKKVRIKIPHATGEGVVEAKKDEQQEIVEFPLPVSEEEAIRTIKQFERGAEGIRGDDEVADSVAQHMLHDRTSLLKERWLGSEEEERNAYVSELLYIHSKLMIIDDRIVVMGSANLNDRSQKGDGDSEIALVVEDTDEIPSRMNNQPYMATRFAATLRRQLYREHLGLILPQNLDGPRDPITSFMHAAPIPNDYDENSREDRLVADPLCDNTMNLWQGTAKKNRDIFTEVFRPVPSDLVQNFEVYKNYVPKVKSGHIVPDIPLEHAKERLSDIRGALVEMPLQFLADEKSLIDGPEWKGLNPTLPIYI